jgi:peptide chain release factor 3
MSEQSIGAHAARRRTFAIISHPDAGKTTLTEKLLLFGGAIRLAGTVKGRKVGKFAASDWMDIEKQRGISVTSSVLQFDYAQRRINILDTPGHQDFSEDTFRTLTAADSAVMLIDMAKGVEAQTRKLFRVCRARRIPIFTFMNKLDREGRDPLDVINEVEDVLGIQAVPMNWPIGQGRQLCGVYDRMYHVVERYGGHSGITIEQTAGRDDVLRSVAGSLYDSVCEQLALLDGAGNAFDAEAVQAGEQTPVFFGSAMSNFGVRTFLERFLELAPAPSRRRSGDEWIEPTHPAFSGYVFKIQANMNVAHRDRMAFLRIVSGTFVRGMSVWNDRMGKEVKLTQPQQFLAQERDAVDVAYPGDIIGLYDPGVFRIGDTLTTQKGIVFQELPTFAPELFGQIMMKHALKHKAFTKGVAQLCEEGTVQLLRTVQTGDLILGVLGTLQFEVFLYRMKHEYGVDVDVQRLPFQIARWVVGDRVDASDFRVNSMLCTDKLGQTVALFDSEYALLSAKERLGSVQFLETAPA